MNLIAKNSVKFCSSFLSVYQFHIMVFIKVYPIDNEKQLVVEQFKVTEFTALHLFHLWSITIAKREFKAICE